MKIITLTLAALVGSLSLSAQTHPSPDKQEKIMKSNEEWKQELTPEQYYVLREKGTERAFTGAYEHVYDPGVYLCAACGNEVFSSRAKYDSGSGWPSFWEPIRPNSVELKPDRSWFMVRTEITCARCGSHLGHVFDDGPQPTGQRYCINSVALKFIPDPSATQDKDR